MKYKTEESTETSAAREAVNHQGCGVFVVHREQDSGGWTVLKRHYNKQDTTTPTQPDKEQDTTQLAVWVQSAARCAFTRYIPPQKDTTTRSSMKMTQDRWPFDTVWVSSSLVIASADAVADVGSLGWCAR